MKNKKYEFYENETVESIVDLLNRSAELYKNNVAVQYKKKRKLYSKSYIDIVRDSKYAAKQLINMNYMKGHIAILGGSSYEWLISYFSIMYAGMVAVPLDKELSQAELSEILKDSDSEVLIFDKEYEDIAKNLQSIISGLRLIYMDELLENRSKDGMTLSDKGLPQVKPDKMSAIVYTSGTTGKSKGVMLTQKNIAYNVICGLGAVELRHGEDVILSVLPFHHTYEFTCTILGMLYKGVKICISGGIKYISKDFIEYKPTVMFVVPLLVEKLYDQIWLTAKKNNKEKSLGHAIRICKIFEYFGINLKQKLLKDVHSAFGGRLRIIMCGGAPLTEKLIDAYKNLGINLFQGYGLTECSPLLTVNFDWYHRPNSVGKIVKYCSAKVVDGEIWACGDTVSKGYYNNESATKEAFEDGYFKTGDLGYIDEDGFVFLTGRKKNLIIMSNGENVSAEELEGKIYKLPYVKEVLVYGKNNAITAEVFLDDEKFESGSEVIYKDIDAINNQLPIYKNIGNIVIRTTEFPKTTTKKIKRY